MSQTTRCPRCATVFRVVADQLRIGGGWVRCGQCKEVFDATEHLQERPAAALLPEMPLDDLAAPRSRPAPRTPPAAVRAWGEEDSAPVPPAQAGPPAASTPRPAPAPAHVPPFLLAHPPVDSAPGTDAAAAAHNEPAAEPAGAHLPAGGEGPLVFPRRSARPPQQPQPQEQEQEQEQDAADAPAVPAAGSGDAPSANPSDAAAQPLAGEVPPAHAVSAPVLAESPSQALPLPPAAGLPAPEQTPAQPELRSASEQASMPAAPDAAPAHGSQATAAPAPEPAPLDDADVPAPQTALGPEPQATPEHPPQEAAAALATESESATGAPPTLFPDSAFEPGPEPEFVRAARRGAFWRQPAVRGVLLLLALALSALLAAQVGLHHRDEVVTRQPALRALLQPLCQQLGCVLSAPRTLGAIVIDSSSFSRSRQDAARYELRFALKNTASHAVATPLVELTLTDSLDQPLVRRVLHVQQELGAPAQLEPGAIWSAAATAQAVDLAVPVAGYRLLAFYP